MARDRRQERDDHRPRARPCDVAAHPYLHATQYQTGQQGVGTNTPSKSWAMPCVGWCTRPQERQSQRLGQLPCPALITWILCVPRTLRERRTSNGPDEGGPHGGKRPARTISRLGRQSPVAQLFYLCCIVIRVDCHQLRPLTWHQYEALAGAWRFPDRRGVQPSWPCWRHDSRRCAALNRAAWCLRLSMCRCPGIPIRPITIGDNSVSRRESSRFAWTMSDTPGRDCPMRAGGGS
jgi:hypothetical protein